VEIVIDFEGGTAEWHGIIRRNAATAAEIMSRPAFVEQVRTWPRFAHTTDSPEQVAERIRSAGRLTIAVGFYAKSRTKAIAYEQNGRVYFNTLKQKYGAGSPGNIAHETTHTLGYKHKGNRRRPNINSVPYRIGDWVEELAGVIAKSDRRFVDGPG
jgi:hypothetical protein